MTGFLHRNWGKIIIFLVMLGALGFFFLAPLTWRQSLSEFIYSRTQGIYQPLARGTQSATQWTSQQTDFILRQKVLNDEVVNLQKENAYLVKQLHEFQFQVKDLNRYRHLLGLKNKLPHITVAAEVIAVAPSNYYMTLILNKGTLQKVIRNQVVLDNDGVIGRILEASPRTSKVLLIADQRSAVAVMVERTGSRAILEGMGNGLCKLTLEEPSAQIKAGDKIYTSGIGGIFPKGLYVGHVDLIKRDKRSGWAILVRVRPAADNYSIQEALVIIHPNYPPVTVTPDDES
jgi:rod shape-determining protein MreC